MKQYNIFYGNKLIEDAIIDGLKIKQNEYSDIKKKYNKKRFIHTSFAFWFRKTFHILKLENFLYNNFKKLYKKPLPIYKQLYYFETYFYLTNRFGMPEINDECKEVGTWNFKVKNYDITITLDSTFVNIIMWGDKKFENYGMASPYWIARWRKIKKVKKLLFTEDFSDISDDFDKLTEKQEFKNNEIWDNFLKEQNIENFTQEQFNNWFTDEKEILWQKFTQDFNAKIIGINEKEYDKKYGKYYTNSKTKHALRTLKKFLNNMLTPIWVRDCDFNIKGRGGVEYLKYKDNIKIDFMKN